MAEQGDDTAGNGINGAAHEFKRHEESLDVEFRREITEKPTSDLVEFKRHDESPDVEFKREKFEEPTTDLVEFKRYE